MGISLLQFKVMAPLTAIATIAIVGTANAFTTTSQTTMGTSRATSLCMSDGQPPSSRNPIERGVSMDQDGKSNVWAIEPKMEVENKSSEEQAGSALLAVGGFAAFAAIAAVALTNLPDHYYRCRPSTVLHNDWQNKEKLDDP